jgi:hypothetical protein
MKKLVIAAFFTVATFAPMLAGAETAQQAKMKTCNTEASAQKLSGPDRQKFMSTCLKGGSTAAAGDHQLTAQQQKMKDCNAQASQQKLKGKERKSFMSTCLSGKSTM